MSCGTWKEWRNYGMITAELTRKIDLLPQEAYHKVEQFVEQLTVLTASEDREKAFQVFMDKMNAAEKSIKDRYYTEEEVEEELTKV